MTIHSVPTRLGEYISTLLEGAHGHQRDATIDFVFALIHVRSCCQAKLARFFDNHEAATKRLSRYLHNPRLEVEELASSTAALVVGQLRFIACVRVSVDWTVEDGKHMLVASLVTGARAIPIFWRGYAASSLKGHTREYEQAFFTDLITKVLSDVSRLRIVVTADRGFADVEHFDLLEKLGILFVIRSKGSITVWYEHEWRRLSSLRFRRNERRRQLGRLLYCQSKPRRVWLTIARARTKNGGWEVWYLLSNRAVSAHAVVHEYKKRFTCEHGFRDAKRTLGFAEAKINDVEAWTRMFTLVAIAMAIIVGIGSRLVHERIRVEEWFRRVRSRRRRRKELSLLRTIAELLPTVSDLWDFLDPRAKLYAEADL
jgi:hypothetical protein